KKPHPRQLFPSVFLLGGGERGTLAARGTPRSPRPATMAAVRCAARRLGGSLLQRTQAAVAEEGRLLSPSRLMRSRQLSTKVSGEVSYPKLTSLIFLIMITASRIDVASNNRILCNRNSNIYLKQSTIT
uniref:Uncharacterized protein n=1 Tax=Aegilops tauschii subsp. strangulata TaxID=200361 RepID=A0A453A418_AEGTS